MLPLENTCDQPEAIIGLENQFLVLFLSVRHAARIQDFFSGRGGGVQARRPENSLDNIVLVLSLFYNLQRGSNGLFTEKTILFQGSRGGPTFSKGGGPTFSRGGGWGVP